MKEFKMSWSWLNYDLPFTGTSAPNYATNLVSVRLLGLHKYPKHDKQIKKLEFVIN